MTRAYVCILAVIGALNGCGDDDGDDRQDARDAATDAQPASDAQIADRSDAQIDAQISLDARIGGDAEAALDAAPVADAGPEAAASDGAPVCRLDGPVRYFFVGGNTRYESTYSVDNDGLFRRENKDLVDPDAGSACVAQLPACAGPKLDLYDLSSALDAADPWFTRDEALVLGRDARPVDGAVLVVIRGDGKRVTIGNDCEFAVGCTDVPAPVMDLSDFLFGLSTQMAERGPCMSLRI